MKQVAFPEIRSTVKMTFKRHVLFQGTFLAALGAILFLYLGVVGIDNALYRWSVMGAAFFLIAWGLIPYRHLCALENEPLILKLLPGEVLALSRKTVLWSLPIILIGDYEYVEEKSRYGILFTIISSESGSPSTLFAPFFSRLSYQQLQEALRKEEFMD